MKTPVLLFCFIFAVPAGAAAQTQSRERRSSDQEPVRVQSTAVRDRVVGPTRSANHVAKKATPETTDTPAAGPQPDVKGSTASNQTTAAPKWGNAAVSARAEVKEIVADKSNGDQKQKAPVRDSQPTRKLVQPTSLITEVSRPDPLIENTTTAKTLSGRGPAPTVVYHVGVGDVLDIRLSNLPTRESTLYTVLKNGSLEYPLLGAPVPVAGMTADAIARLLTNEIKVIKTARISVSVRDYASHVVDITGMVDSPGRKAMRREAMPLFAVLAEALPRPEASLATIVRNGTSQTVSLSNELAMSTLILPGDAIKISGGNSVSRRYIYVGGDVASSGEKEFRDGMTLTQAILSAGGTARGARISVRIARRDTSGFLKSSEFKLQSIEEGKSQDPLLEAGDRIEVTRGM